MITIFKKIDLVEGNQYLSEENEGELVILPSGMRNEKVIKIFHSKAIFYLNFSINKKA